jgi:ribosomal protein S18 acetylase RimI-like enzyme
MTVVNLQAADTVPEAQLHQAFTDAFADYLIGPLQLSLVQWPGVLARQGVDLALSRVNVDEQGVVLAFALVAPRLQHRRWRLATMGAVPKARGTGAAVQLLMDFANRAEAAGCLSVELEVFAQNERARRLYERHGFVVMDELHGYAGRPARQGHADEAGPQQISWGEAMDWLDEAEAQGLAMPLQQTRVALAAAQGQQAWRRGTALVTGAARPDDAATFILGAVMDRQPAQEDLQSLLVSLAARHPQWQHWHMPQILRPSLGGEALARIGLQRQALHQLWMLKTI